MKLTLHFYKLFFCFTFLCGFTAHSQIVNIPDQEFKQALISYYPNIDTNNDGDIQEAEAEAVTSLTITNYQYMMMMDPCMDPMDPNCTGGGGLEVYGINDFTGIEAFINLTYLNCSTNDLSSLNISALTQLTYLDCSSNINYNGAPYSTGISSLQLPNTSTLTTVIAGYNNIAGSLDLTSLLNLETLDLNSNQITAILLPNSNTLESLKIKQNQLNSINLIPNTGLTYLDCSYNALSALDIDANTLLSTLICSNNQLPDLNVSQNSNLAILDCRNNQLTSLDVLQNPLISYLDCRLNSITSLDVTQQRTALTRLYCSDNNLSSLNMKNGNNTDLSASSYFRVENNPSLSLICVDNIVYASATFNNIDSQMFFAENCSFIPAMSNTITGTIAYDFDVNGCDAADVKSINTKIATVSNNVSSLTFTNTNGVYTLYTPDASSTTSITPNYPSFFTVSPSSQTSIFASTGNTDVVDYCITANSLVEDVSIDVLPTFEARPGFQTSVRVFYKNNGSAIVSGSFDFSYDEDMQTLNSTSETPISEVGNLLTWNYSNLLPFESRYVDVFLTTNTPTDTNNPVNNGDILNYTGNISTTTGDIDSTNNTTIVDDMTIGSYDPNDSIFLEGEYITVQEASAFLHVRIRFQNTGTASAINIRVETLLDSDLDWDTFEPMTASHNFVTKLSDNNKAEFFFENIYLDDSTSNEPASHGWVYFKIKPKTDFTIGDIADSTASIFFDYNSPIITNTATTQIETTLSIEDATNNQPIFVAYPNPAKENLTVSMETEASYRLTTVNGQVINQGQFKKGKNTLNTSNLANGLYFLQVKTATGLSSKKILKE